MSHSYWKSLWTQRPFSPITGEADIFRENPAVTRGKATHDLSYAFTLSAEGTHPSRGQVKGTVRCTFDRFSGTIHVFRMLTLSSSFVLDADNISAQTS